MSGGPKVLVEDYSVFYGEHQALRGLNLTVHRHEILAIFGPAGGGKTTLLRSMNRLIDNTRGVRHTGRILLDREDIFAPDADVVKLRRRVGMILALPVAFPMSVFDNLAYGPRMSGVRDRKRLEEI
ncbi:MAG: ATP-binding cassette domain-containing protein, partial [Armatimonadota bacterium]|nr:ATP-binding cassette domain-containing protein [Armatimonadota bacterium]